MKRRLVAELRRQRRGAANQNVDETPDGLRDQAAGVTRRNPTERNAIPG